MTITEQEWKEHKKTVNELRDTVNNISEFLIGNEYQKEGLISRVERLESNSRKREKIGWIAAGVMSVVTVLVKFGENIVKFIR